MTKYEFLRELENTLEKAPESISGDEALDDLGCWDSLAALAFMAMVDRKLGLNLTGAQIQKCKSIADLVGLVGDLIT